MTYNIRATVNYPDGEEQDTPVRNNATQVQVGEWIKLLLAAEPDATSYVITICKEP